MVNEWQLRRDICEAGRRVFQRGLAAGTDGNLSARIAGDAALITPSGSCLGMLEPGDLITIDGFGRVLGGRGRPSSEWWMHTTVYKERPDAMAAIHAHPPITVAFTVAGLSMSQCALPEVILAFGRVPVAEYATPSTAEGAEAVKDLIKRFDALVLDRHGALTVGKSVHDAFFKLDKLEHGARVMLTAHELGRTRDLPPEEVAKLGALRERLGLGRAEDIAPECIPPRTPAPRLDQRKEAY